MAARRSADSVKHEHVLRQFEEHGATWFLGSQAHHPMQRARAHGEQLAHSFFVARDHMDGATMRKPTKVFGSYASGADFHEHLLACPEDRRGFYELVRPDVPCRLFADLEWDTTWRDVAHVRETFETLLRKQLTRMGEDAAEHPLVVMDASRDHKGSLHVVVPTLAFRNVGEQQRFWNAIYALQCADNDEAHWFLGTTEKSYVHKTFIDYSVYTANRLFRTVHSGKMDKHGQLQRPLQPMEQRVQAQDHYITWLSGSETTLNCSGLPADIQCTKRTRYDKAVLQGILDELGLQLSSDGTEGALIKVQPTHAERQCPVCNEQHVKSRNAVFLTIRDGVLYYHCRAASAAGRKHVLHRFAHVEGAARDATFESLNSALHHYRDDYMRQQMQPDDSDDDDDDGDARAEREKKRWNDFCARVRSNLNLHCARVTGGAKALVFYKGQTTDETTCEKETIWLAKTIPNFREAFAHMTVVRRAGAGAANKKTRSTAVALVDLWLLWPEQRTYERVDCNPQHDAHREPEVLNTFERLAIPREMALERSVMDRDEKLRLDQWLGFIRTAWCHDVEEHFEYTMNWFAHLVQRPGVKMGTALVLRGVQGAGKGMVVQVLGKILGSRHWLQPTSPDDVLGSFNHLLKDKFLVFADEMSWDGDKKRAGALKKLITEHTMTINEKHNPQFQTANRINWIMASNDEWVVPAGPSCRRFQFIDLGDQLTRMTPAECQQLAEISPYVVARYLYARDISAFDPTNVVSTAGLVQQKLLSMHPVHSWWLTAVDDDKCPFGKPMRKEDMYTAYKHSQAKACDANIFWSVMRKLHRFTEERPRAANGKRPRCVQLPTRREAIARLNNVYHCILVTPEIPVRSP